MTSEMVAIVARAMAMADSGPEGSQLYEIHWREFGPGYLKGARVAIETMRSPPDEVVAAIEAKAQERYEAAPNMQRFYGEDIWVAAIDAALGAPAPIPQHGEKP